MRAPGWLSFVSSHDDDGGCTCLYNRYGIVAKNFDVEMCKSHEEGYFSLTLGKEVYPIPEWGRENEVLQVLDKIKHEQPLFLIDHIDYFKQYARLFNVKI